MSILDVYLELLKIARQSPFGAECRFSAYSLLKALGRQTGNKDHKWLHSVIVRLRSGTVDMTDHRARYFGGLVDGGKRLSGTGSALSDRPGSDPVPDPARRCP